MNQVNDTLKSVLESPFANIAAFFGFVYLILQMRKVWHEGSIAKLKHGDAKREQGHDDAKNKRMSRRVLVEFAAVALVSVYTLAYAAYVASTTDSVTNLSIFRIVFSTGLEKVGLEKVSGTIFDDQRFLTPFLLLQPI